MGGNGLCNGPNLKHQGQNDLGPLLEDIIEHQNAYLMCSPCRPTVLEHNLGCMISQCVDAKQLSSPTKWSQQ